MSVCLIKCRFILKFLLLCLSLIPLTGQSKSPKPFVDLPLSQDQSLIILSNRGYMTGFSECKRSALWVYYPLTQKRFKKWPKRRPVFKADQRTHSHVSPDDYWYSGYDRGHLAPGYAVWSVSGKKARTETYFMSNIVPQKRRLNQKLWQRLEEVATTYFTRYFERIHVYTGPIYTTRQFLDSGVRIPDALFKIFIATKQGKTQTLAFIMPQTVKGNEPLNQYVVSIDRIEAVTGLDFFPQLSKAQQQQIESRLSMKPWHLKQLSNLPGRY